MGLKFKVPLLSRYISMLPRLRWEDNNKVQLFEVGWEGVNFSRIMTSGWLL